MIKPSEKSYAVAVILAGIFGILGFQHFYLGRLGHGLFDLGLSIAGFCLIFFSQSPVGVLAGTVFLGIDVLHSFYVFYKLMVGEYRDGEGCLVTYPGQKLTRSSDDQSI